MKIARNKTKFENTSRIDPPFVVLSVEPIVVDPELSVVLEVDAVGSVVELLIGGAFVVVVVVVVNGFLIQTGKLGF